jgi:hypothetical protein
VLQSASTANVTSRQSNQRGFERWFLHLFLLHTTFPSNFSHHLTTPSYRHIYHPLPQSSLSPTLRLQHPAQSPFEPLTYGSE